MFVTNAEIIAELEAGVVEAACAGGDAAFAERIKQRGGKIMYDAPLFVGIFAHPAKFSGVDAGIAVQNIAPWPQKASAWIPSYSGCRGSLLKARMRQNIRNCSV